LKISMLRSVPFIHWILKGFQPNDQAWCSTCIGLLRL
jgi:hypothetical protein